MQSGLILKFQGVEGNDTLKGLIQSNYCPYAKMVQYIHNGNNAAYISFRHRRALEATYDRLLANPPKIKGKVPTISILKEGKEERGIMDIFTRESLSIHNIKMGIGSTSSSPAPVRGGVMDEEHEDKTDV
eukprot:Sspe_Gene.86269::Locus_56962_Transcript_1_1_Confidence_1.000_Length_441::g.86269::m.86269